MTFAQISSCWTNREGLERDFEPFDTRFRTSFVPSGVGCVVRFVDVVSRTLAYCADQQCTGAQWRALDQRVVGPPCRRCRNTDGKPPLSATRGRRTGRCAKSNALGLGANGGARMQPAPFGGQLVARLVQLEEISAGDASRIKRTAERGWREFDVFRRCRFGRAF